MSPLFGRAVPGGGKSGGLSVVAVGILALLAGCGGIGDGNAPESLEIAVGGQTTDAEVFACATQVPQARLEFTDGSVGDFVRRIRWSSADDQVLNVSDGSIETANGFFVNGALLPVTPGTTTIRADYLDGLFVDTIDVTVSPARLEVTPVRVLALPGRTVQLVDTLVREGLTQFSASDLNQVGVFSIEGIDPADFDDDPATDTPSAPARVGSVDGAFVASEPGVYRVQYAIDFCGASTVAEVEVTNATVERVEVRDRVTGQPVTGALELFPDSSRDIDVFGVLEGGREIVLTNSVSYNVLDADGEPVNDVIFSTLRGLGTISAFGRSPAEEGVDPVPFPREVTLRVGFDPTLEDDTDATVDDDIFAPDIPVRVLDASLDPDTLRIAQDGLTILPGTGITLTVRGDFRGPAGEFVDVDLSKDVQWLSGDTARATVNNTIGSKGFVFAPVQRVERNADDTANEAVTNLGSVVITARRFSAADGTTTTLPEVAATLAVGQPDAAEGETAPAPVTLAALQVELVDSAAPRTLGESFSVRAEGELQREATLVNTQDLSGQVIWDIVEGADFAHISNRSGRKGQITVLTDQTVEIVVRARYFNSVVQDAVVSATVAVELNPVAP